MTGDIEKKPGPGLFSKYIECNKTVNKIIKDLYVRRVKTWYIEKAVNNKTFCQYKLVCHDIAHVVAVSSMNFPSKIQIRKTWIKVLTLKTQMNTNTKKLSIAHLNIHSLCSTFDEFSVFLHTYCIGIMTLSTQWAHHVELTWIRRGYYVDTSKTKFRRISTSFPRTFSM